MSIHRTVIVIDTQLAFSSLRILADESAADMMSSIKVCYTWLANATRTQRCSEAHHLLVDSGVVYTYGHRVRRLAAGEVEFAIGTEVRVCEQSATVPLRRILWVEVSPKTHVRNTWYARHRRSAGRQWVRRELAVRLGCGRTSCAWYSLRNDSEEKEGTAARQPRRR